MLITAFPLQRDSVARAARNLDFSRRLLFFCGRTVAFNLRWLEIKPEHAETTTVESKGTGKL
jgi:hypothetical protein